MTDIGTNHQTQTTHKTWVADRPNTGMQVRSKSVVTIEEVNRVLEVGRLLRSVLTDEELEELQRILNSVSGEDKIGNAGVT